MLPQMKIFTTMLALILGVLAGFGQAQKNEGPQPRYVAPGDEEVRGDDERCTEERCGGGG